MRIWKLGFQWFQSISNDLGLWSPTSTSRFLFGCQVGEGYLKRPELTARPGVLALSDDVWIPMRLVIGTKACKKNKSSSPEAAKRNNKIVLGWFVSLCVFFLPQTMVCDSFPQQQQNPRLFWSRQGSFRQHQQYGRLYLSLEGLVWLRRFLMGLFTYIWLSCTLKLDAWKWSGCFILVLAKTLKY